MKFYGFEKKISSFDRECVFISNISSNLKHYLVFCQVAVTNSTELHELNSQQKQRLFNLLTSVRIKCFIMVLDLLNDKHLRILLSA